jgi:hypothetical protein
VIHPAATQSAGAFHQRRGADNASFCASHRAVRVYDASNGASRLNNRPRQPIICGN